MELNGVWEFGFDFVVSTSPILTLLPTKGKMKQKRTGQHIQAQSFILNGSAETFMIDVSNLSSGVYVYNIISKGIHIGTGKFIIVK